MSSNFGKESCRITLKAQDSTREILSKYLLRSAKQNVATLAFGQQLNPKENLRFCNRGGKKFRVRLFGNPSLDVGRGCEPHKLGEHISIKNDHWESLGGSRMGSRDGNSSSTPPSTANRWWILSARFPLGGGELCKADRKISLASCSMERPWRAARTLNRALVCSSSFRMVIVAMLSMLASLKMTYNRAVEPFSKPRNRRTLAAV